MANCPPNVIPLQSGKPCSGKCGRKQCSADDVWVLAASEGMAMLFRKLPDGEFACLQEYVSPGPLVGTLSHTLEQACESGAFRQLILVGGQSDVAWMMLSLPENVTKRVIAEIRYPLLPTWFMPGENTGPLLSALKNALTA